MHVMRKYNAKPQRICSFFIVEMRRFLLKNEFFLVDSNVSIVGNYIFLMSRLLAVVDVIISVILHQRTWLLC